MQENNLQQITCRIPSEGDLLKESACEDKQQSGYEAQHAFGRTAARCGSQLPTAIYQHRALEKGKREVRNSCGLCFEPMIMLQTSVHTYECLKTNVEK